MERGKLLVFEGSEGTGKSTQLRLLAEKLSAAGIPVVALREPGGTPVGDAIRSILLDPQNDISAAGESLLFMASRAEIVRRQIQPALRRGDIVLIDRFFLSTYAYQIGGRGLAESDVRAANCLATDGLVADLTLVLELPVAEGMRRAAERGTPDRIENAADDFHIRVERSFAASASADWQREHPECGPIVMVDGTGSRHDVFRRVVAAVLEAMPERFAVLRRDPAS